LWKNGVREHLIKKVAIEVLGPEGIETKDITRRDIFYKNDDYSIVVDASDAELTASVAQQKNKLSFLTQNSLNPLVNQSKNFEFQAKTVGFNDEEIKELMDKTSYGNSKIMSEAERDLEYLLDGKDIKPNKNANLAYKQKFVNFLKDHEEDMNEEEFRRVVAYIEKLESVIIENDMRERMLQNPTNQPDLTKPAAASAEVLPADNTLNQ
jgi:hypothetical protein